MSVASDLFDRVVGLGRLIADDGCDLRFVLREQLDLYQRSRYATDATARELAKWRLCELNKRHGRRVGGGLCPVCYPPGDQRRQLDGLEEQIGAQHDRVASLMHERNARPDDVDITARLARAFQDLRAMQQAYADQLAVLSRPEVPMPSDEDSETVKKAMEFLARTPEGPGPIG